MNGQNSRPERGQVRPKILTAKNHSTQRYLNDRQPWSALWSAVILSLLLVSSGCQSGRPVDKKMLKSWNGLKWENIERQRFDYSCGAAALATLMTSYFNLPIKEEGVMWIMVNQLTPAGLEDRQRHGFSLLDLKYAANRVGLHAAGIKLKAEQIDKLKGPIIILLHNGQIDHFAILKGIYKDRAYLADSSRGNIRIPLYQLAAQWDGTALVLGMENFGLPEKHKLMADPGIDYRPEQTLLRSILY